MISRNYQFPKIDVEMYNEFNEWWHSHNEGKCAHRNHGAIGGAVTFKIAPTSIGDFVEAKCTCGDWIKLGEGI